MVIKPIKEKKKELLDKNIAFRKLCGSDTCENKEERSQLDKKESHSGWDSARSGLRLLCASHLNIFVVQENCLYSVNHVLNKR